MRLKTTVFRRSVVAQGKILNNCDLSGKTVLPFCTHGGGGKERVLSDVEALCPQSVVKEGLAISSGNVNDAVIKEWLYKTGVFD